MERVQFKTTVYREGDPPLVAGAPPVELEPEPETARRGLPWWAVLWYICHVSIIGGAFITHISYTRGDTYELGSWLAGPIGIAAALALGGITLVVWRRTR
jgi:hypothetical protein